VILFINCINLKGECFGSTLKKDLILHEKLVGKDVKMEQNLQIQVLMSYLIGNRKILGKFY